MATPVVTCGNNIFLSYSASGQAAGLTASATGGATSYAWELLSAPVGSTAFIETRGSFVAGVSSVQNPSFETDPALEGAYVFQCIATGAGIPSVPDNDKSSAQQVIIVRTQRFALTYANDYQWEWGDAITNSLSLLEAAIGTIAPIAHSHVTSDITAFDTAVSNNTDVSSNTSARHAQSHALGSADHTAATLAQLNAKVSDATLIDTTDSRLSDARTPTSHSTSHKSAGGDPIKLDELAAPTDITTLNATTGQHGLLPKLGGGTTNFLRADGTWAAPAGGGVSISVEDEGTPLTTAVTKFNFAGAGVTVTEPVADQMLVTIPGGGASSPLTTKGDLWGYSTTDARIPVGTDGQVLVADAAEATGVKWDDVSAGLSADFIKLTNDQHTSNINISGSDVQVIPGSGGGLSFTALNTCDYAVRAGFQCAASSSAATAAFYLVFDEGETYVQTVTPGNTWRARAVAGAYTNVFFEWDVSLTAGTHTVKLYGSAVTGTTFQIIGSSVTTNMAPFIILHAITGGGGGANLYVDTFTASGGDEDFTISAAPATNTNTPSGYDIVGVTVNGVGLAYDATPADAFEFGYASGSTEIVTKALLAGDLVEVRYLI